MRPLPAARSLTTLFPKFPSRFFLTFFLPLRFCAGVSALCGVLYPACGSPCIAQTVAPEITVKPSGASSTPGGKLKPYAEVTKGGQPQQGVFTVFRIEDKILYEIPAAELGKEFLIVAQVAKTQNSYGYGGTELGDRVVRWEKRGDKILLRNIDYSVRSTDGQVSSAVTNSNLDAILMSFELKALGKDSSVVIDVTDLFTSDMPEFSPRQQSVQFAQSYDATSLDAKRTFIESVKTFPTNIETEVLLTYRANPVDLGRILQSPVPQPFRPRADFSLGSISVVVHFSMVRLPDTPMKPREFDSRVGFFTETFADFGAQTNGVDRKRYISRFRLEKKEPNAELSEPVKPIIFYIAPEVPAKWRPFIKRGVEAWQRAFEKAGFKNAILAKDAPEGVTAWDAEDARYSSIRWLPSQISNAYGPSIRDPRSGEVLDADIKFFDNIKKINEQWYFLQCGAVDARTDKMPLPDAVAGELIEYVTTHEVGHCLGFPHNWKASSSYSVKQLRDSVFTAKYGTEASVMDYGRMNYVAQPGDGARLIPMVGPYDEFAVEWGYKPFNALTPETEKAELNKIAERQLTNPMLRFGREGNPLDPTAQREDLGSEPIEASTLGFKNLVRVAKKFVTAFSRRDEDYERLAEISRALFSQRTFEANAVAALIGGMVETNYVYGQAEKNFEPVAREKQKEAMKFLQENVFKIPDDVLPKEVTNRIGSTGYADLILQHQRAILGTLFGTVKTKAMVDYELTGESRYALVEMVGDLSDGIFSELRGGSVKVGAVRRNLQRELVSQLIAKTVNAPPRPVPFGVPVAESSEMRAVARGHLSKLLAQFKSKRGADEATSYHLTDLTVIIKNALEKAS